MRQQKELALLHGSAPHVKFPAPHDETFNRFKHSLKVVLEANNMYNAARGLVWEADQQCFWWEEEMSTRISNKPVKVTVTFEIFPLLAGHTIQEQLEAIIEKRKELSTECFRLAREDEKENENA